MEVSRSESLLLLLLHQTNTPQCTNQHAKKLVWSTNRASNLLLEKHTFVQPKTIASNANFRPQSRDKWTDNPQKSFTKQVLNKLDLEFKDDNTLSRYIPYIRYHMMQTVIDSLILFITHSLSLTHDSLTQEHTWINVNVI